MNSIYFEWDTIKAEKNVRKHGVSFEEARTVFGDPFARIGEDSKHSDEEDRFIIIGESRRSRVLLVCHCRRDFGNTIRIISARKATKKETAEYRRYRGV